MAFETTRKEIRRDYPERFIFRMGYCELYPLQNYFREVAYTSGIYGWNFSVFETDRGCAILTGYRGMFGRDLPEKAVRILRNAKKHEKTLTDYAKREKYLKSAARRFAAALIED